MGISAIKEKVVNIPLAQKDNILLIKRFSGGGTVYIDEQTIFVTFLLNFADFSLPAFPNALLHFSEKIYAPFFQPHPFSLRENDFVLGEKKMGGNAEYVRKERGLLHTSFLWDYSAEKMEYLHLPERRPKYRQERSHADFLTPLSQHFKDKEEWIYNLKGHLNKVFSGKNVSLESAHPFLQTPHRRSTEVIAL
jgi:lipoate-protein ligase A